MNTPHPMTNQLRTRWPFPNPSARTLAILAVVGAAITWGSSAVATKAALAELPPMTVAFASLARAYFVLSPAVATESGAAIR